MAEIKSYTYEESRLEYFRQQRAHAERCLEYWVKVMPKGKMGYTQIDIEDKCSEYGAIINYYEDAINALGGKKMTDLISRSELLDKIYSDKRPTFYDGADVANWQMNCIYCAPAVDAEPVRHGHWIDPDDGDGITACICSICDWHGHIMEDDVMGMNYCPNCGAKMRGNIDASE